MAALGVADLHSTVAFNERLKFTDFSKPALGKPISAERHPISVGAHPELIEEDYDKNGGVKLKIYAQWLRREMDGETACLELPFTILMLVTFAVFAISYLRQDVIMRVEDAVTTDIIENAKFAWAHYYGHKNIYDVNSFADFWSWTRLGLFTLFIQEKPWAYSEGLSSALPHLEGLPAYDVDALPGRRQILDARRPVPILGEYLRYNRVLGGLRFQQEVSEPQMRLCYLAPGHTRDWQKKGCTGQTKYEMPTDHFVADTIKNPVRVEWLNLNVDNVSTLLEHVIDMEDGCVSAQARNRTCLCEWCTKESIIWPWLDERTVRVEISILLYNPEYGIYTMASPNFFFNRGGHIVKFVYCKSAYAGLGTRSLEDLVAFCVMGTIWILLSCYVCWAEVKEMVSVIWTNPGKKWYRAIAENYVGFWNFVDWVSIIIALACILSWLVVQGHTQRVNDLLANIAKGIDNPESTTGDGEDIFEAAETLFSSERDFRTCLATYPVLVLLRLFKSFAAQPRLAIVTETFSKGKSDILHFSIIFMSVWFCFAVDALLFFGQDLIDYATLDRALLTSFRAILGDSSWSDLMGSGLGKAFLYFASFMLFMVLLLFNIVIAILMDAYLQVKASTEGAVTLFRQTRNILARWKNTRDGLVVGLNSIWIALLLEEGDDDIMLESDRIITPDHLQNIVAGLSEKQAVWTLRQALSEYLQKTAPPFTVETLQEPIKHICEQSEDSAACSMWLSKTLSNHARDEASHTAEEEARRLSEGEVEPLSPADAALTEAQMAAEERAMVRLEDAENATADRIRSLVDGVSGVLSEEMSNLERRQKEQERSVAALQAAMNGVRTLVYKLNQTCLEIADVSGCGMQQPGAESGAPHRKSVHSMLDLRTRSK